LLHASVFVGRRAVYVVLYMYSDCSNGRVQVKKTEKEGKASKDMATDLPLNVRRVVLSRVVVAGVGVAVCVVYESKLDGEWPGRRPVRRLLGGSAAHHLHQP
jgi:hypothetical protein